VFVCQGNLCRSPFAEGVFRGLASGLGVRGFTTQSAGFVQPGRVSPREAVAAAADVGIDLAQHRSQLVSPDMLRRAALVVVMSRDQARLIRQRFGSRTAPMILLGDLDPLPSSARDVEDPWGESQEVFDVCYARIGRCVDELVRAVTSSASYASASR
jgi:protein-tyrosine-phosphatase